MNKLITALVVSISFLIAMPASADVGQSLCQYIKADDKKRLRSLLKSSKIKIRNIFDDARCNGANLIEFAGKHNSLETGKLIISKLPKRKVTDILPTITSADLAAAAQERVGA